MSPKLFLASAAIAAVAFTALPASAQEPAPAPEAPAATDAKPAGPGIPFRMQILFNIIDVNADGTIDQTEILALQKAVFAAVDTDKDGKLSQAEFGKVVGGQGDRARHAARMMRGDGPRGGHFMHRGGQRGDRDGGPRGERGDHRRGGPDGRRSELPAQPGDGMERSFGDTMIVVPQDPTEFAALDLNGDGVISMDEFGPLPAFPGMPDLPR